MKINLDCLRDVLGYCIETIDYKPYQNQMSVIYANYPTMCESEQLKNYENKDVMYSILKLYECGFLKSNDIQSKYINHCNIYDVSYKGHQFYETIRSKTIWEQTKLIAKQFSNSSLDFLKSTAHDMAVEAAKEAVKSAVAPLNALNSATKLVDTITHDS